MLRHLAVRWWLGECRGEGSRGRDAPGPGAWNKFFDTAQAYGFGTSEQLVGKALEPEIKNRREEVILPTKGGLRMEGSQMFRDSSPDWLRRGVEDSLRFLSTD
jgi:aryl-alcohol dehydrogenase-like predicted oxidoreductase